MANRDAKKIERTLKDFSLNVNVDGSSGGGSSEILTNYDMFKMLEHREGEVLYLDFTKLKALLENAGVDMQRRIELTGNQNEYIGFNICNDMITMLICKHVEAYVWLNLEVFGQTIFNEKELPDYNTLNEIFDYLITLQNEEQPLVPLDIAELLDADIQALTFVEDRHHYQQEPYYYDIYKAAKSDWNSLWKRVIIEPMVLNLVCKENNSVETNYTVEEIVKQWEIAPDTITIHKYYPEGTCVDEEMRQAYIENIQYMESGDPNARPVMITLGNPFIAENTYIYFDSNIQVFKWMYQSPL